MTLRMDVVIRMLSVLFSRCDAARPAQNSPTSEKASARGVYTSTLASLYEVQFHFEQI